MIAKLSEGSYVGISQSGNVAVISTPMDKELSRLNERIGTTLIPYGDSKLQAEVHAKYAMAASAPVSRNGRSTQLQQQDREGCAGPR